MSDKTTLELVAEITRLTAELEKVKRDADRDQRNFSYTHKVNDMFDEVARYWNAITIVGRVVTVNNNAGHENFYIVTGDTYFCVNGPHSFQLGDTAMIFGRITGHSAYTQEDRDNGYYGVGRIYIEPDRTLLISHADDKVIKID